MAKLAGSRDRETSKNDKLKNRKGKPSWKYLFLARRIQTAQRHYAAKLVLLHLADAADDHGRSWHGYDSIAAFCSINRSSVARGLRYLRDDLRILTWTPGSGGVNKKDTNTYVLDLEAMKGLVAAQGVFNAETGKLIRPEEPNEEGQSSRMPQPESSRMPQLSVESHERSVESHERVGRVAPCASNPQGTPREDPPVENPAAAPPFSACHQIHSTAPASAGQRPPLARPPRVNNTPPSFEWWGRSLSGCEFRTGEDAGYWSLATGQRIAFSAAEELAKALVTAQMEN